MLATINDNFILHAMKLIKIGFVISLSLFVFWGLKAQNGGCGTLVTMAQQSLESTINLLPVKSTEGVTQLNRTLSITVYIVRDETGDPGITSQNIQLAVNKLNQVFSPVALKFNICATNYIDNYQFNSISPAVNETDLITQFNSKNTINLYFVSTLSDIAGNGLLGYTYMPADAKDVIFLTKTSITGNEIIHQFGHFFNLYHTHEIIFGAELVNESNCRTAGDKCCDTYADPGLFSTVTSDCVYNGSAVDSNKKHYVPSVGNFMSLSRDNCRSFFTNDQYQRVVYTITNLKNYLW